ncbi:DUF1289 domain-containing protein [Vibrio sp. MA40-2]|uniref:DUF1289 domain-containing protein n=1 Tax=Vibrio sp. MA40-2 TaxID=3391828 RepID=UPI0039A641ED
MTKHKQTDLFTNESQSIASPCVRHCCLDDDDVCLGCNRTLSEILGWSASTNQKKAEILAWAQVRKNGRKYSF